MKSQSNHRRRSHYHQHDDDDNEEYQKGVSTAVSGRKTLLNCDEASSGSSSSSSGDDDDDDDDHSFVEDTVHNSTTESSSRSRKQSSAFIEGVGGDESSSEDDSENDDSDGPRDGNDDGNDDDDDDEDDNNDDYSNSSQEDEPKKKGGDEDGTDRRKTKTRRFDYYEDDVDVDGMDDNVKEKNNDDDDDQSSSASSGGEDLPLSERIRLKEEKGLAVVLKKSRERKSRALEVAAERLAAIQRKQKDKHQPGNSTKRKRGDDIEEKGEGDILAASSSSSFAHQHTENKTKKKSKHRPTEVSSKRIDFFRRGAPKLNESGVGVEIGAHRYRPLDPRVSNLSGHFDEEQFQKNYAFLDEIRNREIGQVRKRIAARRATGGKGRRLRKALGISGGDEGGGSLEEDEARLKALTQDRAALERSKVERAAKRSVKRKIQDEVATGKHGAYFLKRKERKRLEMEAKIEEIRKRGGNKAVEKMLDRKRRRNKSRDAGMFAK